MKRAIVFDHTPPRLGTGIMVRAYDPERSEVVGVSRGVMTYGWPWTTYAKRLRLAKADALEDLERQREAEYAHAVEEVPPMKRPKVPPPPLGNPSGCRR